jgi:ATP-dependent DNA helicase DinG
MTALAQATSRFDAAAFFANDGALARTLEGYEARAEQIEVSQRIAEHLEVGGRLLVEAGTGTGKTLAYLAPLLANGRKAVISTGTKTLQDQLAGKDLPLLARALGRPIDFQVMKGRSNYLCMLHAEDFARSPPLPGTAERVSFDRLLEWGASTDDGDRAGLTGLADDAIQWREVSSTSEQCRGRNCTHFERCFVTQMRRRAQAAELIIVNHHLYFADLALRARGPDAGISLLPEHDIVVFDEAHELDEVAAQHFGVHLSERRVQELAHDIARAVRAEPALIARFGKIVGLLDVRARELFDALPFDGVKMRATLSPTMNGAVRDRLLRLDELLEEVENELSATALDDRGLLSRRAAAIAHELSFCLGAPARHSLVTELDEPDASQSFVRYTETNGRSRAVVARPVDVSGLLDNTLRAPASVFCSATLRVGDTFQHYRTRLGLADAEEIAVGSPFDYSANAALYLPADMPDPDQRDFMDEACARVDALVSASAGGAFVLCTSYRMLQTLRDRLTARTLILAQGEAPKAELIDRFREHGDAVLLGTMTFWSGVDVAGRALRQVIIDKLPFASPSDPLVQARVNHLRLKGEDPFSTYQLPTAALLLRQGFGRLIRRTDDRGMVTILDRRLTQRSYGRLFLRSLPACPRITTLTDAQSFLESL